jgi:hypothetical protein
MGTFVSARPPASSICCQARRNYERGGSQLGQRRFPPPPACARFREKRGGLRRGETEAEGRWRPGVPLLKWRRKMASFGRVVIAHHTVADADLFAPANFLLDLRGFDRALARPGSSSKLT